jgi:hypothetical protein
MSISVEMRTAAPEGGTQGDGAVDVPFRHHLPDVLDDEVDQPALRNRQQIANLCGDHLLDRRPAQHLLQGLREVLDDDDDAGAGVLQLVLQFARRVQWIDVDHGHPGAQDADEHHRVLQEVGRHDRHALALDHPRQSLQEGRKGTRLQIQFSVA